MAKLIPVTANASGYYADFGTGLPPTAIDGAFGTAWSSLKTGNAIAGEVFALIFDQPVTPKRFEFWLSSWGRSVQIGYADAYSNNKSDYTILTSVDTVQPDAAGNTWVTPSANTTKNVIALPDNNVAARVWMFCAPTMGSTVYVGAMNSSAGNVSVDRLRIREIELFDAVQDGPAVNPKVPNIVPVSPWTASPANWTRTEFSSVGSFSFTPREDTVLMLVIAQGGGAAGRVRADLGANPTPTTGLAGGDAIVSNAQGAILLAPGGRVPTIPGAITGPQNTFENWIRYTDLSARAGGTVSSLVAPAGGRTTLNTGVAGAAWTLASISSNAPATSATQSFTGANPATQLTWEFANGGVRQNTTGLSLSSLNASVTLRFKAVEGQAINVTYISTAGSKPFTATLNGVVVDQRTLSTSSSTVAYVAMESGDQTLIVTMTGSPTGTLGLSRLSFGEFGSPGGYSGASGRSGHVYLMPTPLNIVVPAGGVGQAGGQAVTAAQNGTFGSGGAVGGDGGNGAVIVYEYRGVLVSTSPPEYNLVNYNVATAELAGLYRTDYVGQGIATKQNYTHKLRPRTKNVLVIMSGCGGGNSQLINVVLPEITNDPAIVSAGSKTFTAGSGASSYRALSGSYIMPESGRGGIFSANAETIWQSDGLSSGPSALGRSIGIFSSYGSSRDGIYTGTNTSTTQSGGSGSGAFIYLSESDLQSRTIDVQVPGQGDGPGTRQNYGYPGVVSIFETESDIGPQITQLSSQTLIKNAQSATWITHVTEQALIKNPQTATQITQISEQALIKEKQVGTQITQVVEQVLVRESDLLTNPLQLSYAAIAYIVDAPDPQTAITQVSEQALIRDKQAPTQITQNVQQILLKALLAQYRTTQVTQQILVAENPSVFWLNFGNLEYPMKDVLYDSRTARATSVPQGAYIQLEGAFAPGSYMLVNGVNVGLSSPVKENDQVQLHSGVSNYWQLSINVYAYYTTNGEVTREMIGRWNVIQPNLSPVKPRAYSMVYTNRNWILLKNGYATAMLVSRFSKANAVVGKLVAVLFAGARTMIGTSLTPVRHAVNYGKNSLTQEISKVYHRLATGAASIITQAQDSYNDITFDSGAGITVARFEMGTKFPQTYYGMGNVADTAIVAPIGASALAGLEAEISIAYTGETLQEFDAIPTGNTAGVDIAFERSNDGYMELTDFHFEYNAVGKSFSDVQEYIAMVSTGFAAPFYMGFTDTIAYSVLGSFEYINFQAGGLGFWNMPTDTAELSQAKMVLMQLFPAEKSIGHSEFVSRTPETHGAHDFHNFTSTPITAGVGISKFQQSVIKRVERVTHVQIDWVRVKAQMGVGKNTPYRPAQAINGRGKASLYMGFDTLADVRDYTSNYSDVTTLQMYNGYAYNVGVDKSFVCEIYFNGPISGLIRGG